MRYVFISSGKPNTVETLIRVAFILMSTSTLPCKLKKKNTGLDLSKTKHTEYCFKKKNGECYLCCLIIVYSELCN